MILKSANMDAPGYICLNGDFLKANTPSLFADNRAFRFADALRENIHACSTQAQFLDDHMERLIHDMQAMNMQVPAWFSNTNMSQLITRLLNKNRIFGGAILRLIVFRNTEADNVPGKTDVSFVITSDKLEHNQYVLNEGGLFIDICGDYIKNTGPLAGLRDAHALLYLMADLYARNHHLDAAILLNESGKLVETCNSNIFLLSGESLYTPAIHQGCVPGVMRKVVIRLAAQAGFRVNDQSVLTPPALLDAEEIFLTNATNGIRWAGAYQQRRYYNRGAKLLTASLNKIAF